MNKLDVSVIVPLSKRRLDFFEGYTLPSIIGNNALEVILVDEEGSAPEKRNKGAAKAKGKYLFFCDDDNILKRQCLSEMVDALEKTPASSFAYCNFAVFNLHPAFGKPMNNLFLSKPWDPASLKERNYIDTGSLILAEHFPGFDEKMPRFQDWDLWLTMADQGRQGIHVNQILFMTFHFDRGISTSISAEEAEALVRKKHNLEKPS